MFTRTLRLISLLLLLALSSRATDYYVSPTGSDSDPGTLAQPFKTLAHAETMHGNVYMRAGSYYLTNTLSINYLDSGATWSPYNNEAVQILGGLPITNFVAYSGSIVKADVSTQGFGNHFTQLLFNGARQPLARYPNYDSGDPYGGGWAYVDGTLGGSGNSKTQLTNKLADVRTWARPTDGQVFIFATQGSTRHFWNNIPAISSVDTPNRTIYLASQTSYNISPGDRYYVQGMFEELDAAGEWYLDPTNKNVYFWPPSSLTGSTVVAPVLTNLITIASGSSNITFQGFKMVCCVGQAVTMTGTTNCIVTGNSFQSVGDYNNSAVIVSGGWTNGVTRNTFTSVGRHAIEISGGTTTTLTPANNYAENNTITFPGVDYKEGSGIWLQGVGNRASHNLIHDGPRFGVYFYGQNLVIEYNHIYNMMLETDDGAGIYTEGINWLGSRGSVVRYNYLHGIIGYGLFGGSRGTPWLAHGVYIDAFSGGVTVLGNITAGTSGEGLFLNGGSANVFTNNIVADCVHPGSAPDPNNFAMHAQCYPTNDGNWSGQVAAFNTGFYSVQGQSAWANMPDMTIAPTNHNDANGLTMWSNRIFGNIFTYTNSLPGYAYYAYNVAYDRNLWDSNVVYYGGSSVATRTNSSFPTWAQWQSIPEDANSSTGNPLLNTNTWQVAGSSPALALGFQQIPFSQIGPQTNIIPSDRLPAAGWVPGVTVGVRGGIPAPRTNIIDVTQPPYNADNTGASSAVAAITAAITAAAAVSNDVVYLPAGTYDITSGLALRASHITLRGSGSNTVLVGSINAGNDPNVSVGYTFTPTNGYSKGSTSLLMSNVVDQWGTSISPGDAFIIDSQLVGDANWQYIASNGGEPGIGRALRQPLLVTGKTGNTMTVTPPLAWDFTNNTQLHGQTQLGISSIGMYTGVGIENLTLTTTNGGLSSSAVFMLKLSMLTDSWVTNCWLLNGYNYNLYCEDCLHCEIAHNQIGGSRGVGSNHAGLLVARDSGCLFQDNIIADGLSPGLEYNDGFVGNAVFGNFFTNNNNDVVMHNTHPCMNLWEENVSSGFEIDGYFGSCSHETLLRNNIAGTIAIKRWTSYIQVVGNVIGSTSYPFQYLPRASGYGPPWAILEVGYPNIGNENFDGVAGPISWNWPGNHMAGFYGEQITNGVFTITSTQLNTNVLWGNFTNLWPVAAHGNWSQYVLLFQDAANTNAYWNPVAVAGQPTTSNVLVGAATSVTNGQRIYVVNQNAYQWLDTSNLYTDILTGNSVCTNQSSFNVVWDASGSQSIPASFLYTNGAPPWWGTNRWPAIDPVATVALTPIPAQLRYLGIPNPPPPTTNIGGIFSFGGRPILRNGP